MKTRTAAAAIALGRSMSIVPVAAFAATPAQEGAVTSVTASNVSTSKFTLTANKSTVAPGKKVIFSTTAPITANAVLYQNGVPAPNIHPIPVKKGSVSKFYYEPGMTGTYFLRIGNAYQSDSVAVTVS